jgi:hypothetical protein
VFCKRRGSVTDSILAFKVEATHALYLLCVFHPRLGLL